MTNNDEKDFSISIAPRYDLLSESNFFHKTSTFILIFYIILDPRAFGAIDGKVINGDLLKNGKTWIYSSPVHFDVPPFSFEKFKDIPHRGIPELMNFEWCLQDIKEI